MNPRLDALQIYPFEKLRHLLATAGAPPKNVSLINLSVGEPKHATPACVVAAMHQALPNGLASYPPTKGSAELRAVIADWQNRRYGIPALDPETQVLPVLGSREALFSFAQVALDPTGNDVVICPNPFYQIYEGATLLAGAQPYYVNAEPDRNFRPDWSQVPQEIWRRTRLVFVCSPGNPAGNVMAMDDWQELFQLSDRYDFIVASDECYSEIYAEESHPPIGALQAAYAQGRRDYKNLLVFSSLSKRSNVPGLRSGFVAGAASLISRFLHYRTYHGSAMSPVVAAASIAAWRDEAHVQENRRAYRAKFAAVVPILKTALAVTAPAASFYLWVPTPQADTDFARDLYAQTGVTVLPGRFLARHVQGINPGEHRVRMALVPPLQECIEAAQRIVAFVKTAL
jgi:N-succinyldiaminopimelate aminotransferase